MSTIQRLFKNTTVLFIANSIQPVLSFYFIVLITKYLGVDGLGEYSTVFYYQAIFQIFASFGLKNLLVRDVAQNRSEAGKYFTHSTIIAVPFSILTIIVMIVVVKMMNYNQNIFFAILCMSVSIIPAALSDVFEGIISAFEKLSIIGYNWIFENLIRICISIWFVMQGYGLIALVWIFVIIKTMKTVFYFLYINKKITPFKSQITFRFSWELIKKARIFALIMACVILYWKIDVILLSKYLSMDDVGIYTAAYRFLFLGMLLVDSFINSLFPVISNMFKNANENFEMTCKKSIQFLIIVTIPISVSLSFFSDAVIPFLYGPELAKSIEVLRWIIWVIIPYGISQVFAYAMVASNRQKYDLLVNFVGMIVNFIANIILIRLFGYMGAVYAALLSISIYVFVQIPIIHSKILKIEFFKWTLNFAKLLGATFLMITFMNLFKDKNFMIVSVSGSLIYFGSLFIFKVFNAQEKKIIVTFMKRLLPVSGISRI